MTGTIAGAMGAIIVETGAGSAVENIRGSIDLAGYVPYAWFTPENVARLWWTPLILCVVSLAWGFWPHPKPETVRETEPEFIPITEAGQWAYEHGGDAVRALLREGIPSTWASVTEHGAAYVKTGAAIGNYPLFGRWEDGLPMEKIDPEGADFSAFEKVFGHERQIAKDLSVKRTALPALLEYVREVAEVRRTKPERPVKRDKDLREGVGWIVFKAWGHTPETSGGGRLADFGEAWKLVHQAARDDDITIWGKPGSPQNLFEEIPPEFWRDHDVDFLRLWYPSSEVTTRTSRNNQMAGSDYVELMVSSREFEDEWPEG